MLKLKLKNFRMLLGTAATVAAGLVVSVPTAADTVYSWRTDDGTYAFTDAIKNVPERYRSSAEVRKLSGLSDYARYTPQDSLAATLYEDAVGARIAQLESRRALENEAETPAQNVGHTVSLRTGGMSSPSIELTSTGTDAGPMLVETMFTRPADSMATRSSVVVTQGGRTLAVVKPRVRAWNVNDDIHSEDEFAN